MITEVICLTDYIIIALLVLTVVLLVVLLLKRNNKSLEDKLKTEFSNQMGQNRVELRQGLNDVNLNIVKQLNEVYKSIGEMRNLSSSVSDLQRLLTNVKARGTWAEIQLGNILEQILTNDQYEKNVSIKNNAERVEFAIKIPSREEDGKFAYLPIDSKFPQEDYLRLVQASEIADRVAVQESIKSLERTVKSEAADISKLYIDVPKTTDFAIMFLPTEGLYAEVLRIPGLSEEIQRKYRVMVCGPTTITAFLNTLQVGFRTITLDKRAAEVWRVLGAAKQQYELFSANFEKAKRKLNEATNAIEDAEKRNSIIQKKLKDVEKLEPNEADALLNGVDNQ